MASHVLMSTNVTEVMGFVNRLVVINNGFFMNQR